VLSLAAGYHADATHNGSFVWSDYSSGSSLLKDTAVNQFVARASGGVYFYSNEAGTSGVRLAPGSGTWGSLSDRNAKTGIVALDEDSILAKVVALPIDAWQYKSEPACGTWDPWPRTFMRRSVWAKTTGTSPRSTKMGSRSQRSRRCIASIRDSARRSTARRTLNGATTPALPCWAGTSIVSMRPSQRSFAAVEPSGANDQTMRVRGISFRIASGINASVTASIRARCLWNNRPRPITPSPTTVSTTGNESESLKAHARCPM